MVVDSFRIALKALGRNKLRTLLTMLGMIIGVAAVMTMVALGNGAQASVEDEMKSAGTNLIYITAGNYVRGGDDIKVASGLGAAKTLTVADGQAVRAGVKGIKHWTPGLGDRAPMVAGDRRHFGRVIGTTPEVAPMFSWTVNRGAVFTASDVSTAARTAVLGAVAAETLFGRGVDPVGKTFQIRKDTFIVAGVTDSKVEDQPESAFVPYTVVQQMKGVRHIETLTLAAEQAGEATRIAEEASAVLRIRHKIGAGDGRAIAGVPDDFTVKTEAAKALTKGLYTSAAVFVLANLPSLDEITLEEMAGTLQQTSRTLTALLASIAAISLIVGGIGIMNIMLVSVIDVT